MKLRNHVRCSKRSATAPHRLQLGRPAEGAREKVELPCPLSRGRGRRHSRAGFSFLLFIFILFVFFDGPFIFSSSFELFCFVCFEQHISCKHSFPIGSQLEKIPRAQRALHLMVARHLSGGGQSIPPHVTDVIPYNSKSLSNLI